MQNKKNCKNFSEILIIIPVYNESKNIFRCLESIKKQDFRDFRVLIHDNASTDNTNFVASGFSISDSRFILKKIAKHESASQNWRKATNLALELVESNFVVFLSGDDYFQDLDYLSKLVEHAQKFKGAIVIPNFCYELEKNDLITKEINLAPLKYTFPSVRLIKFLTSWKYVHTIYGLYPREIFVKLFVNPASTFSENRASDWWWVLHAVLESKIYVVRDATYVRNSRIRRPEFTNPNSFSQSNIFSQSFSIYEILRSIRQFPRRLFHRTTISFREQFDDTVHFITLKLRYLVILFCFSASKFIYLLSFNILLAFTKIPLLALKLSYLAKRKT